MKKEKQVYLIDDDNIEGLKLERVLKTIHLNYKLLHFTDGLDALKHLKQTPANPKIILLDLNMFNFSGLDFLKTIKNDKLLKSIPVIVLTTSSNIKDVTKCYSLGAGGYVVKPLKYDDYISKIKCVFNYWNCNELVLNNEV